jgi:hypothetical protein
VAIRRNMILIGLSRLVKASAPPEFLAVSTLPGLRTVFFGVVGAESADAALRWVRSAKML